MKTKGILLIALFTGLVAGQALAADRGTWTDRFKYENDNAAKFGASELSLDMFGTYANRDRYGVKDDRWGGGLGLNYFVNRYVGISADSYIEEWKAPYRVNGSLVLRLPIDTLGLAPYAFGGGGREFKYVPQWSTHAGVGLELRMNPKFGIFADGRRVFNDKTSDTTLIRAGLRFGF